MEDKQAKLLTWMAGLLTLLVTAIVFIDSDGNNEPDQEHPRIAQVFDEHGFSQINIFAEDEGVTLTKNEEQWWNITQPQTIKANQDVVKDIVRTLSMVRCEDIVSDEVHAEFGLQPPVIRVNAQNNAGDVVSINIGADAPVGKVSYVECGDGKVRLANYHLRELPATLDEIRSRTLADFEQPDKIVIDRANVARTPLLADGQASNGYVREDELTIRMDEGRWVTADGRAVDAGAAKKLITILGQMQAQSFDAPELTEPVTTITIHEDDSKLAIRIGSNRSVTATGMNTPMTVLNGLDEMLPDTTSMLQSTLFDGQAGFQDLTVTALDSQQVNKASYVDGHWSEVWAVNIIEAAVDRHQVSSDCGTSTHEVMLTDGLDHSQKMWVTIGKNNCARDLQSGVAFRLNPQTASVLQTLP